MKWLVTILVLTSAVDLLAAGWSPDWPLAATGLTSLSTRHFQDLLAGVNERCLGTWYQETAGTNYFRVDPIRLTYTVPVSTGLYVSGTTTNTFIEFTNGVPFTNVYVFTNWAVATTNATCTNFDCSGPSGVFTNPGFATKSFIDAIDDKIYRLMDYYVAGTVVSHVVSFDYATWWAAVYTANTNTFPENVSSYSFNYPPKWAYETSPTNWVRILGIGGIVYPYDSTVEYGGLMTWPERLATNLLLGEFRFVVTNTYYTTNGSDLVANKQLGVKWVDVATYPISNAPLAVWSNPAAFSAQFVNPAPNPAASSFIMYYQGMARMWDNHVYQPTNQPRTYALNDAQPRGLAGTDTWYVLGFVQPFDILSASGTIDRTEADGDATIIGSALRLFVTNKASLYGYAVSQSGGVAGPTMPYVPTPEALNERYYAINALRYRAYAASVYTGIVYKAHAGTFDGCAYTNAASVQDAAVAAWTNSVQSPALGAYAQVQGFCGECWEASLLHNGSKLSATVGGSLTGISKIATFYVTAQPAGTGTNDTFDAAGDAVSVGVNLVDTATQAAGETNQSIRGSSYVGAASTLPTWPTAPTVPDCSNVYGATKGWISKAPPSALGGDAIAVVDFHFEYRNW